MAGRTRPPRSWPAPPCRCVAGGPRPSDRGPRLRDGGEPMSAWQEVRDLITARAEAELTERVLALTDAERAEVAGRLPGFVKELRTTATEMARASWGLENGFGADQSTWPDWAQSDLRWEVR